MTIIKDDEEVHVAEPNEQDVQFQWTDPKPTPGKTSYYYVRGEQVPDMEGATAGELVWASPMWIRVEAVGGFRWFDYRSLRLADRVRIAQPINIVPVPVCTLGLRPSCGACRLPLRGALRWVLRTRSGSSDDGQKNQNRDTVLSSFCRSH